MNMNILEPIVNPTAGQIAILAELQCFLNRETWLLDHDRLEAWLELFTDDIRYNAPVRKEASRRILRRARSPDALRRYVRHTHDAGRKAANQSILVRGPAVARAPVDQQC